MNKDDLTQAELDEIFYGKPPKVEAKFYDEVVVDPDASAAAGRRVTKTLPHIHLRCVKEQSEGRRPVQDADKRKFPAEWAAYERSKQDGLPSGHRAVENAHTQGHEGGEAGEYIPGAVHPFTIRTAG